MQHRRMSGERRTKILKLVIPSVIVSSMVIAAAASDEYGACDRVTGIFGSQAIEGQEWGAGFCFHDLDGDGAEELVRLNGAARRLRILTQDHLGDWVERSSTQFSEAPLLSTVGDFNGDGHDDVFVSNRFHEWCGFALGASELQMMPGGEFEPDYRLKNVVSFDCSGDGRDDVIATTASNSRLAIFRGDADDGLLAPEYVSIPAFSIGESIRCADLNGDNLVDLIIAGDNGLFAVLLGDEGGSFEDPVLQSIGGDPTTLELADLNGDGLLDIVAACFDAQLIETWASEGDGSFTLLQSLPLSHKTASATAGDVNGDGRPDVAVIHQFESVVRILLNDGAGLLIPQPERYGAGWLPLRTHVHDVTGDDVPDLVIDAQQAAMPVLVGIGDGTFAGDRVVPLMRALGSPAFADVNGDGLHDVVGSASGSELDVYLGTGTVELSFHDSFENGSLVGDLALADVSGSDVLDLVTLSNFNDIAVFKVFEGSGDGHFALTLERTIPFEGRDFELGDFSGDGLPDAVFWSHSEPMVHVLSGHADGFEELPQSFVVDDNVRSGGTADVNGDGNVDLTFLVEDLPIIGAIAGDGAGGFGARIDIELDWTPSAYAFGDATNDGIDDLVYVTRDLSTNRIVILRGTGDSFELNQVLLAGVQDLGPVVIRDLDEDGYLDVLVRHLFHAEYVPCYGEPGGVVAMDRSFWVGNDVVTSGPILMTDLVDPDHLGIVHMEGDLPGLYVRSGHCRQQGLCAADLDGTFVVDTNDLLLLIGAWGTDGGDLDRDGTTDIDDLLLLMGAWGPCN